MADNRSRQNFAAKTVLEVSEENFDAIFEALDLEESLQNEFNDDVC